MCTKTDKLYEIYSALSFSELLKFKCKRLIIWRDFEQVDKIFSYEEIINECRQLTIILNELNIAAGNKVSVMLDHSPQIIVLYLSILNHYCSFCPVSLQTKFEDLTECLKRYESSYFICDSFIRENLDLTLLREFKVLEKHLYMYVAKWDVSTIHKRLPLCYSIQTSGSTAEPKIVHVPYSCIVPNIENLSQKLALISEDIIFVTSPPTFDPSIVDILLALKNGATLLMVPKQTRCNPNILSKLIFSDDPTGATILQITPSVFKLFGNKVIKNVIFGNNSSLRTLIFGGEPFPSLKEIKSWVKLSSNSEIKRIFNIYGITEVSCWSSIAQITGETIEVTLGVPIDNETILEVRDNISGEILTQGEGQLFIGSCTRKCLINNEKPEILFNENMLFRSTGDQVSINDGNIIYEGRLDDMIKRFGHRINLRKIESAARNFENVADACCIFWGTKNLLILFYTGTSIKKDEMHQRLRKVLENYEIPNDIVHLHNLPLSSHGKRSHLKLLDWYNSNVFQKGLKDRPLSIFKAFISTILTNCQNGVTSDEPPEKINHLSWDCSFISAGGTSFQAIQLCEQLAEFNETLNGEVLRMLLNENCPLNKVFELVEKADKLSHPIESASKISKLFSLNVEWKYNLGKCVDANPTCINIGNNVIVSIGSHSHLLVNLVAKTGELLSCLTLPDRIEGSVVSLSDHYGILGCYDGHLYKYKIDTGQLIWGFNTAEMIKCKPLIVDNKIIFGNYSNGNNLFCLNSDKQLLWELNVGSKGIYSSPVKFDNDKVIICTLDGTVLLLNINTVTAIWKKNLNSPIFSTCAVLSRNRFLIAEVTGMVHCFNEDGSEAFNFKTNGPIFSSFEIIQNNEGIEFALFGCHDRNTYCLEITENAMCLKWKISLQSQVFSTPKLMKLNEKILIISSSTTGFVNIIDFANGSKLADLQLEGELFSSPAIEENLIFIGCRDNHLYCISVDKLADINKKF